MTEHERWANNLKKSQILQERIIHRQVMLLPRVNGWYDDGCVEGTTSENFSHSSQSRNDVTEFHLLIGQFTLDARVRRTGVYH